MKSSGLFTTIVPSNPDAVGRPVKMPSSGRNKQPSIMYATQARTFQLDSNLYVPPKHYSSFLIDCTEEFEKMVLKENGCRSLAEVAKKYHQELVKANPTIDPKELLDDLTDPLHICMGGRFKFLRPVGYMRPGNAQPSGEYFQDILHRKTTGIDVPLRSRGKAIRKYVSILEEAVERGFKGKVIRHLRYSDRKESKNVYDYPNHFSFRMHMESHPTNMLEATVSLQDHGAMSSRKNNTWTLIPAIEVKSTALSGPMSLPMKVVDKLSEIVADHYSIRNVGHQTSYEIVKS